MDAIATITPIDNGQTSNQFESAINDIHKLTTT